MFQSGTNIFLVRDFAKIIPPRMVCRFGVGGAKPLRRNDLASLDIVRPGCYIDCVGCSLKTDWRGPGNNTPKLEVTMLPQVFSFRLAESDTERLREGIASRMSKGDLTILRNVQDAAILALAHHLGQMRDSTYESLSGREHDRLGIKRVQVLCDPADAPLSEDLTVHDVVVYMTGDEVEA